MSKRKIQLGATKEEIVRAVRANAERCKRDSLKRQLACRTIGLEVSFGILEKKAKGKKVQEELDAGFKKCLKRYDRDDLSREEELISCVAGMDSVVNALGYRTVYDRDAKTWKAVPISGNGNMNGRR